MQDFDFQKEYTLLRTQEEDDGLNISNGSKKQEEHNSSIWQSACNLVGHITGATLLALPYAVKKGGLVTVGALLFLPFICYYTGKILIECLYVKDNANMKIRERTNYKDMAKACWPRFGASVVVVVHFIVLFSAASLYLVLCGLSLYGMLPDVPVSPRLWMTIFACLGLPTLFVKHLSQVAWISLLGLIVLAIAIIIMLAYGVSTSSNWDIKTIPLWDTIGSPMAIPIVLFSYASQEVLPTIEANMREPQRFNMMLALTYVFVCLINTVFALFGFLAFNSNVQEVISNSIQLRSVHVTVNCFLLLNVFLTYPFILKTIIHCIEDSIDLESFPFRVNKWMWYICIRFTTNFLVLLPAVAIPHFALMMSLIGSVTFVLVAFILPCVFHLYLHTEELLWYHKIFDYSIIVFGVVAGIFGTIASFKKMIQTLSEELKSI